MSGGNRSDLRLRAVAMIADCRHARSFFVAHCFNVALPLRRLLSPAACRRQRAARHL